MPAGPGPGELAGPDVVLVADPDGEPEDEAERGVLPVVAVVGDVLVLAAAAPGVCVPQAVTSAAAPATAAPQIARRVIRRDEVMSAVLPWAAPLAVCLYDACRAGEVGSRLRRPGPSPARARHPAARLKINSIVIHDTETSYANTIAIFQNPAAYVSSNYVIQSSTGNITEMVRPQDVAWAVGDWYDNTHSISIEHEGFAAQGSAWYTQVMYRASADLVRYLAHRFGVPLGRQHIVGHDNVPGPTDAYTAAQHWDPGPFWNWTYYMSLLHGVSQRAELARPPTWW